MKWKQQLRIKKTKNNNYIMDLESRYMLLSNGILLGSYTVLSTLMISRTLHCPCFHHSQCPIEPGYPCLCLSGCPSLSSCDLRFDQPVPFVFVCVPIQQELHHQWHEANSHPQRLSLISWTVVTYYLCWLHTHIYDHICWNLRFLRFRETEKKLSTLKRKNKVHNISKKESGLWHCNLKASRCLVTTSMLKSG